jgi:hypothetical protein
VGLHELRVRLERALVLADGAFEIACLAEAHTLLERLARGICQP